MFATEQIVGIAFILVVMRTHRGYEEVQWKSEEGHFKKSLCKALVQLKKYSRLFNLDNFFFLGGFDNCSVLLDFVTVLILHGKQRRKTNLQI